MQGIRDWDALLSTAEDHGVSGVLVDAARRMGVAPRGEAWHRTGQHLLKHALWGDVQADALHKTLKILAADGIEAAVLKGPVLAARLYGDAIVRPSTDLDLLLEPSSLDRAVRALKPLGYVLEGGRPGRFFRRYHHHVHALHPVLPTLELHFDAYRGFGTSLPAGPLLRRAAACRLASWSDATVLAPEDEFFYLAVHAASHRFERLVWLFDLKLLLLRHPELRWDLVAARARAHHLSAVVSFVCGLLADWLDAPAQDAWAHLPRLPDVRRRAAEGLTGRKSGHAVNAVADLLYCTLLCDDLPRAAAFSKRFVAIKVLHEAPSRVRSRLSR
jgi:hypothetical protein